MRRQITNSYVSQEMAEILERELEFSKYISNSIPLPRLKPGKWGTTITDPVAGPLVDDEIAYLPTAPLVRDFLSSVYKVHVFVYPMFGDKLGYDSWEFTGCRYYIGEEDEYGLLFLTYDDLNEWLVSSKYLVNDTWSGEESDKDARSQIYPSHELALLEGLRIALSMVVDKDQYKTWKALRQKRKEEFDQANPKELPDAIWFQTPGGSAARELLLLKDGDVFRSGDTWAKVTLEGGHWFVTESNSPRLISHMAIGITGEKDVEWAKETFKKWWKRDED